MDRRPVVAGQFYPGDPHVLERDVRAAVGQAVPQENEPTILAMVPHAGYVFSGRVAGHTLGQARLARRVVLLGPNHTGQGTPLAVWPDGAWRTPLGDVPVDAPLAEALIAADPAYSADTGAHVREHSLEVVLPFLQILVPQLALTPVVVAESSFAGLEAAAGALARVLGSLDEPACLVVSSDMSHYLPHNAAKRQDALALKAMLALDPASLYDTVRVHSISMCGVLPMTLGLLAARALGATRAKLAAYATSGEVGGDFERVVGYAGVLVS